MAMEHPRFPFHRKYVFECFMLIDHNVKNIHILAQLQVTWCYKYVNNWLVDSTHGFQPHSQFAHLFWLSARAVKFRKHICLIRNLRNKHKEFFGWKGLCWIGKIFGWFQRGSIFNPIEEIFVNLDAFHIGRPGKHVPNSLSHHLVTWNLQSWILHFRQSNKYTKMSSMNQGFDFFGSWTLKGCFIIENSRNSKIWACKFEDMKDDLFQKDGP